MPSNREKLIPNADISDILFMLCNGEIITKRSNSVIRVYVKIAHCKNNMLCMH